MTLPGPTSNPAPQNLRLQRVGIAAAEEMRKSVRAALSTLFGEFLARLPAALSQDSRGAQNPAELRARQELAYSIPADTQRWLDAFVHEVDAHLIGLAAESRGGPAEGEGSVALASIELRAETLHRKAIGELDARLERIRQAVYVPIYTKSLAPAGLCRALQDACDDLELAPSQRRVLFEKFDQMFITELDRFYRGLLDALAQIAEKALQAAEAPAPEAEAARAPDAAAPVDTGEAMAAPQAPVAPAVKISAVPRHLDSDTVGMLKAYAESAGQGGYNDGSLAQDLIALHEHKPLEGVQQDQRWVPLQRMTLAGLFLNEAIADPFVAQELRPQHEAMRFPLVKSALTDATLFTAVTHPLRSLVNDLMLKSATSRITGNLESRRMAELLQQVLVQFDLAPDFVRQAMVNAKPIDEAQVQRFFDMQRQQAQERRHAVINEAKRLVLRELERSTFGRSVPAAAIRFLNSGWGPLMIKRLLQHGALDPSWREGLKLMEDLIDELGMHDAGAAPSAAWQALAGQMCEQLAAEGLSGERLEEMRRCLDEAWRTPAADAG